MTPNPWQTHPIQVYDWQVDGGPGGATTEPDDAINALADAIRATDTARRGTVWQCSVGMERRRIFAQVEQEPISGTVVIRRSPDLHL